MIRNAGIWLANHNMVETLQTDALYCVHSSKNYKQAYEVLHTLDSWACSCKDYLYRGQAVCKHIIAAGLVQDGTRRVKILSQPAKSKNSGGSYISIGKP